MPVATVSQDLVHKDLKSLKDAFVDLKPLPYGKLLFRREMASRMSMGTGTGPQDRKRKGQDDSKLEIEVIQEAVRWYEFKECISDHNLTDRNDRPLDFSNKMDFQQLDPKVGQEIESYIDELNREDEEESEDFYSPSTESSRVAKPKELAKTP